MDSDSAHRLDAGHCRALTFPWSFANSLLFSVEAEGARTEDGETAAGAAGIAEVVTEEEKDMESVGEKEWKKWDKREWSNQVESD